MNFLVNVIFEVVVWMVDRDYQGKGEHEVNVHKEDDEKTEDEV